MLGLAFRPDSWNGLLFVHLLAAFALFGGVLTTAVAGIAAGRRDSPREIYLLTRICYRTDLFVTWPALVILLGAGSVLAGKEHVWDEAWVQAGIGLTLAATILGGIVLVWLNHRVMRRAQGLVAQGVEHSEELRKMADHVVFQLLGMPVLLSFPVLFWLMTAKP